MDDSFKILQMVEEGSLPEQIPNDGDIDINVILRLVDDGLIKANICKIYGLSLVSSPRLTQEGKNKLKQSKLSSKILSAIHNVTAGAWKLILAIIIGVIIGWVVAKFK